MVVDDPAANLLPFVVANHSAGACVQFVVVEFAGAVETFVATVVGATNDVVTTTRDFIAWQDQLFECFQVDWNLQTATRANVFLCCANRKLVVVSHKRIVFRDIDAIDLTTDLDRLVTNKRGAR